MWIEEKFKSMTNGGYAILLEKKKKTSFHMNDSELCSQIDQQFCMFGKYGQEYEKMTLKNT